MLSSYLPCYRWMTPARSWSRFACLVIMRSSDRLFDGPANAGSLALTGYRYRCPAHAGSRAPRQGAQGSTGSTVTQTAGLDAPILGFASQSRLDLSLRRTRSQAALDLRQAHVGWHTAARVIKRAVDQLGWQNRGVSTHTLRHCYALTYLSRVSTCD